MKKNMKFLSLLFVLLFSGTAVCYAQETKKAEVVKTEKAVKMPVVSIEKPAEKKTEKYRIYLALWNGWEDAARGFKDYLSEKKIPFELIVRNANRDAGKVETFVTEAKTMEVDLVVTWGTTLSLGMLGPYHSADPKKHITDIPAVFMIVSQPIGADLVPNLVSSGRNITGTSHLVPVETQLDIAKKYIPFKRLGVVYNPAEANSRINVEKLRLLSGSMNFELIEKEIPLDKNNNPIETSIPYVVENLAKKHPDLIYQGPDAFLNDMRDVFTDAVLKKRIPVFAVAENAVRKSHALFGVTNRYYNVGLMAAKKAVTILRDKIRPEDIPIEAPERYSILINMNTANQLYMHPPVTLLKFSEIVNY